MDIFKTLDAMKAQLVSNTAMVVVDGDRTVVARIVDDKMTLTEEGEKLAKELGNKKPAKGAAKAD